MPEYRRAFQPGGTFYFTVVTQNRDPILRPARTVALLRKAFAVTRGERPFDIDAVVIMPEHIHAIWTLPEDDADFSNRWRLIKSRFTRAYLSAGGIERPPNARRIRKAEHGIWEHRFWEHMVRDEREFEALCDYIHYNPVKHGHAECPHAWPHSSFPKFVRENLYAPDWNCACPTARNKPQEPILPPDITGE